MFRTAEGWASRVAPDSPSAGPTGSMVWPVCAARLGSPARARRSGAGRLVLAAAALLVLRVVVRLLPLGIASGLEVAVLAGMLWWVVQRLAPAWDDERQQLLRQAACGPA